VGLCVVFFFFFSLSFCDSWLDNGSSCFLDVVASHTGEEIGEYLSGVVCYLHRGRQKTKDRRAVFLQKQELYPVE